MITQRDLNGLNLRQLYILRLRVELRIAREKLDLVERDRDAAKEVDDWKGERTKDEEMTDIYSDIVSLKLRLRTARTRQAMRKV